MAWSGEGARAGRVGAVADALVGWARWGPSRAPRRRRFVVVQVCGCSHAVLERALARRRMPALARLLRRGALRLHRVPVGLPTSTPAFQAGVMYGGPVDVPGFEFLDKRTGTYRWFPRPWDAAAVEAWHAAHAPGIVRGGRTYGCVFGGGATDTVLTFAGLLRAEPGWGLRGVRARVVRLLALAWLTLEMSVVTAWALVRWAGSALRDLGLGRRVLPLRRLGARVLVSGWLRELFTLGVTVDVHAGVPALYVNFVDYDVAAHDLGPEHPAAFRALRAVDRSLGRIARAVRRVPELAYDLVVLSDHGQVRCVPFRSVAPGESVAGLVARCFGPLHATDPGGAPPPPAVEASPPMPLWPFAPSWQRGAAYLERPVHERNAVWIGGLCIVAAGPNINVYLVHTRERVLAEEIERRYPGALGRLSRHRAIGFVLSRDARGPVCYYRGEVLRIPPAPGVTGCPVFDRPDRDIVVRGMQDLLDMPSSGDVVLYGHYAEAGCVNYLDERGGHAGPTEAELYGFAAVPAELAPLMAGVTRPRDLYPLFARYHEEPGARAADPPGARPGAAGEEAPRG
jgi:hypothetical protein